MLYDRGYPSIVERENESYTGGHYFVRHDPVVVDVVEQLGPKPTDKLSKIKICEITGNRYRIDKYDGRERVITPDQECYYTIE